MVRMMIVKQGKFNISYLKEKYITKLKMNTKDNCGCGPSDSNNYEDLTCSSCDSSSKSCSSLSNSSCGVSDTSLCLSTDSCESSNSCDTSSACGVPSSCDTSSACDTSKSCGGCDTSSDCKTSSSCDTSSACGDCKTSSCATNSWTDCDSCKTSSCDTKSCGDCKTSSCDCDTSDSCYDPDKKPNCCPEDCSPVKCKEFNIYWFGSSLSDPGNGRLNLGLAPYTIRETPLRDPCGTVKLGFGPCGRASNGKVFNEYVAEDLAMTVDLEYDLCALPENKNYMVVFSLVNAIQKGNITPLTPADQYGYDWEVDRYLELYEESTCYAIPEKDIFMYTDVGANTLYHLWSLIANGESPDIDLYFDSYVNQVVSNITKLYSLGKARRMFVQLIDRYTIEQTPIFDKYGCVLEQEMTLIMEKYEQAQQTLQNELETFAQSQAHFDLTVLTSRYLYEELSENSEAYGIINNGSTMIDLGWPDKVFENQMWFDDAHPSSHTARLLANYVKTWFQQRIC